MKKVLIGIGNAVTDLSVQTSLSVLEQTGLQHGGMTLVNFLEAKELLKQINPDHQNPGGSTANTLHHLASKNHQTTFIGAIGNDKLGKDFQKSFEDVGIHFDPKHCVIDGENSHFSLICITPDSERSMGTFINDNLQIQQSMLSSSDLKSADYLYLESYLWSHPQSKDTVSAACSQFEGKVILTLSDQSCVKENFTEIYEFVSAHTQFVFANHEEVCALMKTPSIDEAKKRCQEMSQITWVITEGRFGASIVSGNQNIHIPAVSVPKVIDKTGAGDLFAAGFIDGLLSGDDLPDCGRKASIAASQIIQQIGARLDYSKHQIYHED